MKNARIITFPVWLLAVLAAICAFIGVTSSGGTGSYEFTSINGTAVTIYGKGIYKHESLSMASQAIAQDLIILALGIPTLIISLFAARKSLKGLFVLAGTLGFFLYTYMSYAFTAMYNDLFLVYVWLMTCSLIAFIFVCCDIIGYRLKECFHEKARLRFTGIFMLIMGVLIGAMWLERIVPPLYYGTMPESLEHYTTLIIQALDLGLVIPAMIIGGVLTLKGNAIGYFLSVILSIKSLALLLSITAMAIGMSNSGVAPNIIEIVIFAVLAAVALANVLIAVRSVKQPLSYL